MPAMILHKLLNIRYFSPICSIVRRQTHLQSVASLAKFMLEVLRYNTNLRRHGFPLS